MPDAPSTGALEAPALAVATTRPDGQAGGQRRREGADRTGRQIGRVVTAPNLARLIALRCRAGPATMRATRRESRAHHVPTGTPVPVRREEP